MLRARHALLFALLALGLVGLLAPMRPGRSLYDDNRLSEAFPIWARWQDPHFAPGDLYTDCSQQPNPRWPATALLWGLTAGGDYTLVWVLSCVLWVGLALLWAAWLWRHWQPLGLAVPLAALLLLAFWVPPVSRFFSLGLWEPLMSPLNAQNLATVSGLLTMLATPMHGAVARPRLVGLVLGWACTIVLHPPFAICLLALWACTLPRLGWRPLATLLALGVGVPLGVVALAFAPAEPLTAAQLAYYTTQETNAFHYQPHRLAVLLPQDASPWAIWGAVVLVLALLTLAVWRQTLKHTAAQGLLLTLAYAASMLAAQLWVVAWPQRWAVQLGPTRYLTFGLVSVLLLLGAALSRLRVSLPVAWGLFGAAVLALAWWGLPSPARWLVLALPLLWLALWAWQRGQYPLPRQLQLLAFGLLLPVAVALGLYHRNDWQADNTAEHPAFYQWVRTQTAPDAVFVGILEPRTLTLLTGRPHFLASANLFTEDCLAEGSRRQHAIFPDSALVARGDFSGAYRIHTPASWCALSRRYRLHYVLTFKDVGWPCTPVFAQDPAFDVYATDSLCTCAHTPHTPAP
jgi:hypothetical protein